ncbi:hypothetical protein G9A89_017352 [Geosiphon pyriformis]|nr:hypothetical protein G9A89_017352 [Geosiphon pyriformis]
MSSPLGVPENVQEYFDPPEKVEQKIKKLANLVRTSKHMVMFTGAGISTSAGNTPWMVDFLGHLWNNLTFHNNNNHHHHHLGVWTLREKGIKMPRTATTKIQPTNGHMAIVKMYEAGYIKYLISQNTDGLHVRSGIPFTAISELHGNSNVERCPNCERSYWRKFSVRETDEVKGHKTSRRCDYCGTYLQDTIVNFSEPLPKEALEKAYNNSQLCDLHIVLGSSLTVSPANDLPQIAVKKKKPLVIVNLQKTPLDSIATLRIFARTDEVLVGLLKELGLDGIDEIRDLKMEPSFNDMLIMPNATRKIEPLKLGMMELRQWPIVKLLNALKERGIVLKNAIEKKELVEIVMRRCGDRIYWV